MVAVDIALSDIEDLVRTNTPLGSHLHTFVVDRTDETVLIHPFFRSAFQVSRYVDSPFLQKCESNTGTMVAYLSNRTHRI